MSIKEAYKLKVPITAKLSKKGCISLIAKRRPFNTTHKND
jgi:hypothetical protein